MPDSTSNKRSNDAGITSRDIDILRRLASTVADISARAIEQEKRNLWYKHNALAPTRPVIFCDPENGWNEIITQDMLKCENPLARSWEMRLRKEIYWGNEICDDRVIEPFFNIPHAFKETDWGMHETRHWSSPEGSFAWDAPLKSYMDMEKLHFPVITIDHKATQDIADLANEILGDILTVRVKTSWWWSFGMTWTLVNLRGLEQIMYDMVDEPEGLHRLMAFLRDGHLARINYLESNGLLSLNNEGTYVGSGGFGWTDELPQNDFNGTVRTSDMWGFAESQETVGVSPDMFEEFIYPYQLPILEKFGLNCYGCCEPVDGRWNIIKNIPRLRRVSVSAWCNLARTADMLQDKYIFSWKPNPADLAAPSFDERRIRDNLREAISITKGCRLEIIMKDNHTICNDPYRVKRWVQIAKEECSGADT